MIYINIICRILLNARPPTNYSPYITHRVVAETLVCPYTSYRSADDVVQPYKLCPSKTWYPWSNYEFPLSYYRIAWWPIPCIASWCDNHSPRLILGCFSWWMRIANPDLEVVPLLAFYIRDKHLKIAKWTNGMKAMKAMRGTAATTATTATTGMRVLSLSTYK